MDKRYSNLFWHQGVKLFEEEFLKKKEGQIKIAHLENDVTKALFNLFQYCNKKLLKSFLKMLNIHDEPSLFNFEFQVFDTKKFRDRQNRIMISIISSSTPQVVAESNFLKKTIPDGAIYNDHTVILIESKTQSALNLSQIEAHVKNFLGTATLERKITWEDLSEQLIEIKKSSDKFDSFLIDQFLGFLELIGIAEFKGFRNDDFIMLGSIEKIPKEEYMDFQRLFNIKVRKFMTKLDEIVKEDLSAFKYFWKCGKFGGWSAFCFTDSDESVGVNKYPNINFIYGLNGIDLSLNAETRPSVEFLLDKIKIAKKELDKIIRRFDEYNVSTYYKVQYRPKNVFIWDLVPGYPKSLKNFKSDELFEDLDSFSKTWNNVLHTILSKMETGELRKRNGEYYSEKEIKHALTRNPRPHIIIHINRKYKVDTIDSLKEKIIPSFKKEIVKLLPIIRFLYEGTEVEKK
jgi:hypothetical protein